MSEHRIIDLANKVNYQARQQYPELARQTGVGSFATSLFTRAMLRLQTPYPYTFTWADTMYPKQDEQGFGRVIQCSREEGLREIHATIGKQQNERSWLYVPAISSWIDASLSVAESSVASDQNMRVFLSHAFPEIEALHTHPDSVVQKLAEDGFGWGYSSNYLLEAARPSPDDFIGTSVVAKLTNPDCRTVDSVVSHYGVTSYRVNDPSSRAGYSLYNYAEHYIAGTTIDPVAAIHAALDAVVAETARPTGEPVFSYTFEPLPSDTHLTRGA